MLTEVGPREGPRLRHRHADSPGRRDRLGPPTLRWSASTRPASSSAPRPTCRRSRPRAAVDARSDIFSFGCVLYEMLTGRRAFDGASEPSLLSSILRDRRPACAACARRWPPARGLVERCLAKDPAAPGFGTGAGAGARGAPRARSARPWDAAAAARRGRPASRSSWPRLAGSASGPGAAARRSAGRGARRCRRSSG